MTHTRRHAPRCQVTALKWEPRDNRAGEWRAYVGKLRLREWDSCEMTGVTRRGHAWQRYEWSIEGHRCRVLASGGAPTRKAARAMAEAAAQAAEKAGLR